jgi:hypothetical protein
VGALPPSPEQREGGGSQARRHRWVGASNRHAARVIAGDSSHQWSLPAGEANPPSRSASFGKAGLQIPGIGYHPNCLLLRADQGELLRGLFEGKLAGVELTAPRDKLKSRINVFLSNPLCRDVDALCTKQAEGIIELKTCICEVRHIYVSQRRSRALLKMSRKSAKGCVNRTASFWRRMRGWRVLWN